MILGVCAQGNRSEIPGEDRCGRCARKEGRRGTGLPGGPWLSASAGDARAEESGGVSGPSALGGLASAERGERAVSAGEEKEERAGLVSGLGWTEVLGFYLSGSLFYL